MNLLDAYVILISIAWPIAWAWIDSQHLNEQEYIEDHSPRALARGLVIALVFAFNWKYGVVMACSFWFLFDGVLSKLRGLKWFYIGEIAKTDKLFSRKMYIFSKFLALSLGVLVWFINK